MPQLFELIAELSSLYGLSGREQSAGEAAVQHLLPFAPDAVFESGSVTAHIGQNPEKMTLPDNASMAERSSWLP